MNAHLGFSRILFLICAGVFCHVASGWAATYYVSANGNDSNPGTSAQPWATLQKATDTVRAGDTVWVTDGNYTGCQISTSGTQESPITFKAYGQNALINSGGPTGDGIRLQNVNYITLEGFKLQGFSERCIAARGATPEAPMHGNIIRGNICRNAASDGYYLSEFGDGLVEKNEIYDSGLADLTHGIYLANAGSKNTIIRGNLLSGTSGFQTNADLSIGGDGLVTGLVLENNIIVDSTGNGIWLDGVQNSLIQNNLIYGSGHHAFRAGQVDGAQGPKNLKIINNTFLAGSSGAAIKLTEDGGGHIIFNNILLVDPGGETSITTGNTNFQSNANVVSNSFSSNSGSTVTTFAQWQAAGHDANSILSSAAALFQNPSADDYHLKAGAPAINAGLASLGTASAPVADITGVPRPQGSGFDIGAYEYPHTTDTPAAPSRLRVR
jgi:parallel beta-helix repeat protein